MASKLIKSAVFLCPLSGDQVHNGFVEFSPGVFVGLGRTKKRERPFICEVPSR